MSPCAVITIFLPESHRNIISRLLVSGRDGEAPVEPLMPQSAQTELRPPTSIRQQYQILPEYLRIKYEINSVWVLTSTHTDSRDIPVPTATDYPT